MRRCLPLMLLAVFGTAAAAADDSTHDDATCVLVLDGQGIEKLVLEDERGIEHPFPTTGPSVALKPGRYRVAEIHLKGNCEHNGLRRGDEWFTASPDKPHHLHAGAPLTPHVEVQRRGRLLEMEYRLQDGAGRRYILANRSDPPCFAVYKNGRQLGAGKFEYG